MFEDIKLWENFLNENIPPDLVIAYRNSKKAKNGSYKNPSAEHSELSRNSKRRTALYDYGKSTYTVLTKEEALRYLQLTLSDNGVCKTSLSKNEYQERIQNLRFLFGDSLAEFEGRGSGIYYTYYCDIEKALPNKTFDFSFASNSGPTLDTKWAKKYIDIYNIINSATKIYKTDEYSHKLSQDFLDSRSEKNQIKKIRQLIGKDERSYNPHNPYSNIKTVAVTQSVLDTGTHNKYSLNDNNFDYDAFSIIEKYSESYNKKMTLFIEYDGCRRALKKLEREKNQYSEEEYEKEFKYLSQEKDNAYKEYIQALESFKKISNKVIKIYDEITYKYNNNLNTYLKELTEALNKLYQVKNKLEKIEDSISLWDYNKNSNTVSKNSRYVDYFEELKNKLEISLKNIKKDREELQQIENETDKNKTQEDLTDNISKFNAYLKDMDDLYDEKISDHLEIIADLEKQVDTYSKKIDMLRPKTAEKKAERAAKNKKPELDSPLTDIIDFVKF